MSNEIGAAEPLTDATSNQGRIYRHTVEVFVERVLARRGLLTETTAHALRTMGVDVSRLTDIDLDTWARVVTFAAGTLTPSRPIDGALEELGREMLAAFSESLPGRALFILLRLMGPQRALLRMSENFQSADSVTRVKARSLANNCIELTFNTTGGMPTYVRGLIVEALRRLDAPAPKVTFSEGDVTVFVVTWG